MSQLTYTPHNLISLKGHAEFNERWLQDLIEKDPTILGLGDVLVLDRERVQERAGRLDLLLSDPDQGTRYEVELMLGATDPSHIIRCIEYWDIERRRYPGYEHVAVLVAEDVTGRFLNVLSLFSGTIPLIAIQVSALQVDDKVVLQCVKVLDQRLLRQDDVVEAKGASVDRSYWVERANEKTVALASGLLTFINEASTTKYELT